MESVGRRVQVLARRRRRARVALSSGIVLVAAAAVAWEVRAPGEDDTAALGTTARTNATVRAPSTTAPVAETTAAATTTTAPPLRTFTIAATGDILLHSPIWRHAATAGRATGERYDFGPMFAATRATLTGADVALCHLETPLSADDNGLSSYPVFSVPYEIADAIAGAGYDGCSTASNHTYDRGAAGVRSTLDHLDAAHVAHAGSARTSAEADAAVVRTFSVQGVRVAHLSYTYGLNGARPSEAWMVRFASAAAITADAHRARAAGAQFVVVSVHWGTEFSTAPNSFQRTLADALLASPDIDLVVGHHAHVVQPVAQLHGKFVAYGLGNFLSSQSKGSCCPAAAQDGVILRFRVQETARGGFTVVGVDAVPTWVDHAHYEIVAAPDASAQRTLAALGPLVTPAALDS